MKKLYKILITILCGVVLLYYTDKLLFMESRYYHHNLYEHSGGKRILGDFIETKGSEYSGDKIIFFDGNEFDTVQFHYQYFSTIKLSDTKTGEIGYYSMKGGSWFDCFVK